MQIESNRKTQDAMFSGVGIDIKDSASHLIKINNNKIHHASSSGIRSNGNDFISIINNEIYQNSRCSSDAGAGVLIKNPVVNQNPSSDNPNANLNPGQNEATFGIINNQIYGNINQVPFYDSSYDDPAYVADPNNNIDLPRPNYGTTANDDGFIVDGSGIKIVSDPTFADSGLTNPSIEISNNDILKNGVEGINIENTNNVQIADNIVAWNGMTSKEAPEDRPDTTGIKITNSEDIILGNGNEVYTYFTDDVAVEIVENDLDQNVCTIAQ